MIKNWESFDENQKRACLLIELFIRKEVGFANWVYERAETYGGLIEQACLLLNCTTLELKALKEKYVSEYEKDYIKSIQTTISTIGIKKFAYDFLVKNSYNLPFVRDVCEYLNISFEELVNYGSAYVSSKRDNNKPYQSQDVCNIYRLFSASLVHIHEANIAGQTFQVDKRNSLFEFLLLLNDEETIEFIKNNIEGRVNFSEYDYKNALRPVYGEEKVNQMFDSIAKKMALYRKYKTDDRQNNRIERLQLSESEIETIENFITCNFNTIGEYADSVGIDANYFNGLIKRAKEFNPELYSKYSDKTSALASQRFKVLTMKINRMGEKIKAGMELPDGATRPFDILDYYGLFPFGVEELSNLLKNNMNVDPEIKRKVFSFIKENGNSREVSTKEILETLHAFINPDGSTRIITKEEKQGAISYLKSHEIPRNLKTYNAVIKRYMSGNIALDVEVSKDETQEIVDKTIK